MKKYDVIVVGGGSAGVVAALSSARSGAETLLIEELSIFGGTNTNSLVGPLVPFLGEENRQIVDGIPQEIIDRLQEIGGSKGHLPDPIDFAYALTPVDFRALQTVQANLINAQENLDVIINTSVVKANVENRKVVSLETINRFGDHRIYSGDVIIDATGDADITTLAGADVIVGRESDGKGQPMTMCFNVGNVDLERVRDDVAANPENFAVSEAIAKGQRMDYVAVSGYFEEVRGSEDFPINRDRLLFFEGVQEGEVGVNTTRILNLSSLNQEELQQAAAEGQRQVLELFKWLRNNIAAFKDSYIKDVGVIGVRESRHIVGHKKLTEMDVLSGAKQERSIAVGAYPIDIHSPDSAMMEFLEENIVRNFEIDLDMLLPTKIDNIIVAGRPISATHAAHAASRVSVTCMAIGQSAGIVAALAAKSRVNVINLNYDAIKTAIHQMGGITER
ncbi:FAD-dependent oxidoreductase [Erysipelothrix sp. HDW6C]|uniref:FAD-dependent oxidoreductase n=1 Tax=Erysipelothrix sp. HDW6C TaxID=2714930 RepID=UPI0014090A93|nr:FAD-dependent oxidoreductase [Erysipelothrix sp. HDW6C]QIK68815.1 FAD-dependent oxidoreductase [Erysipelothrix sp. HDW6C]